MNILHVISTLAPRYGGPTTVLKALAKQQARAGLHVTICTSNADYPKGVLDVQTNVPVREDGVTTWYFPVDFHSLVISRTLYRWAKAHFSAYDLIHIHGLYRFPPTYAAWLARHQGIPYVIIPHGALDPYLYSRSSTSLLLKRLYERWFDLPNLQAASAIHYTAEDERRLAVFLKLRAPSFVVPNGLDWVPFEQSPPRGAMRKAWSLGDAPLVLFLGRLHHKKGLDLLIPAFEQVRQARPDVQLAIVGPANDDYGDQVRSWVRDRGLTAAVTFVDFLSGTDLVQAYVDADVFVLPSYTENFGMTVVEAMACACPVVISRHVNIHEEIVAVDAGLVTECDVNEIAAAILELLNDPAQRHRMGENGRRAVYERYTWPRIVEQLTAEYLNAISRHRGGGD